MFHYFLTTPWRWEKIRNLEGRAIRDTGKPCYLLSRATALRTSAVVYRPGEWLMMPIIAYWYNSTLALLPVVLSRLTVVLERFASRWIMVVEGRWLKGNGRNHTASGIRW